MKKQYLAAALSIVAAAGTLATPTLSLAASKTQNLPVQAQVNVNCNFTSSPTMDFLTYDPTGVNATADLAASVGVNVRCTRGAFVQVGINTGNHAGSAPVGSTRAMKHSVTNNYLGYDFYHESTHTTLWGASGGGLFSFTSASNAPTPVNIYGKIPQNQDVPAGLYQDTVVVEIIY